MGNFFQKIPKYTPSAKVIVGVNKRVRLLTPCNCIYTTTILSPSRFRLPSSSFHRYLLPASNLSYIPFSLC
ncbi:hypothetical protein L2E82_28301 [Cichorium intybus]|uniref:Uncharacterized protein n=1 Tax=Cichorium intybus TaxID=13427 RepID=A0ACB9CV85_CICIN|nr:hypothetical protein L2E82_28301 [Cichorium intybus]